ncbi:MAG: hypothetical protein QOI48_4308 [Solirubrobacteraceae bacterium]|jgi:zinc transporter ZupT|nr:hypothetical protein [Solirubrobacteraceae bacterium]
MAEPGGRCVVPVLTSVPQVPGALLALLAVERFQGLLPVPFALAGGAMLALVVVDLLPGSTHRTCASLRARHPARC